MDSPKPRMDCEHNQCHKYTSSIQLITLQVKDFKFDKRELPEDTPITVEKIILDYMATYVDVWTVLFSSIRYSILTTFYLFKKTERLY